ncbi:MAG: DUF2156 domain-containing protein, partial [Actinobacteria bacterium]|nr:DUF2156 domain-containing protein [Actinomycetota bacterium]
MNSGQQQESALPASGNATDAQTSTGQIPKPRTATRGTTATDFVLRVPTVDRRRARAVRRISAFTVVSDAALTLFCGGFDSIESSTLVTLMLAFWMLSLARGLRRGQRPAMVVTLVLLAASVVTRIPLQPWHLDVLPLAIAVFLWHQRQHFRATVDTARAWRRIAAALLVGLVALVGAVMVAQVWFAVYHHNLHSLGDIFGLHYAELPRAERITIFSIALAVGGLIGYALTTPKMPRRASDLDLANARAVIAEHGHDSLDYFALREDKQFFSAAGGVIAYRIIGGVCLVSPDPIGPDPVRTWQEFRAYAEEQAWPVAVLAADEEWAHRYSSAGGVSLYLGDEAIIDVNTFSLDGRANRGLRQAVNRMHRAGYRVEFMRVADLTTETRRALLDVASKVRRGPQERGFAMTLGRVADPIDPDLLLAVCRDNEGELSGFCQFVPAPSIGGWSLDIMRRDGRQHPNGMMDFLITETIEYVKARGSSHVSLNFALLRSLVEGEDLPMRGIVRRLLRWLVRNVHMDSLYRFNAKFN